MTVSSTPWGVKVTVVSSANRPVGAPSYPAPPRLAAPLPSRAPPRPDPPAVCPGFGFDKCIIFCLLAYDLKAQITPSTRFRKMTRGLGEFIRKNYFPSSTHPPKFKILLSRALSKTQNVLQILLARAPINPPSSHPPQST